MTIQAKTTGHPSLFHVYPVAVGMSKEDHSESMKHILENINSMTRKAGEPPHVTMWNGSTKKNELVSVHLAAIVQDQPERRECAGLLLGGLGVHPRWGWLAKWSQIEKKLIPCAACRQGLVKWWTNRNQDDIPDFPGTCQECCMWMHPSEQVKVKMTVPNDFPTEMLTEEDGTMAVRQLTYQWLPHVAGVAIEKLREKEWNLGKARAFLKMNGLNASTIESIEQSVKEDYEWQAPPVWDSGLDVQQTVEPCMHQLFLGVTKTIVFEVHTWATANKQYSSLRRKLTTKNEDVLKLKLTWCKVQPYKGDELGGWVSENYLAFARILPWAMSSLEEGEAMDEPYVEPSNPTNQWTKDECVSFLRSRGLPTGGRRDELRQRVTENKELPIRESAHLMLTPVRLALVSLWMMLSLLMGTHNAPDQICDAAEYLIRIFLTTCADLDKVTASAANRKRPFWLTAYNFSVSHHIPMSWHQIGCVSYLVGVTPNLTQCHQITTSGYQMQL